MPVLTDALIEALRADTPGCAGPRVHFNHAGASLSSRRTLATITDHLALEAEVGPMEAAVMAADGVARTRAAAATLLNATPEEIAFATGGSAAWGTAIASLPPLRPGDRILVGRQEWGGNLTTLRDKAARAGAAVEVIPSLEDGRVDVDALAGLIDGRVRLVSLTWGAANGGLVNDAAAVGRVARAAGVPYVIDAAQVVGQIPVDVRALGCDMLKAPGRKHLRGPRGTALLYVRRDFLDKVTPAWLDVQSSPWATHLGADHGPVSPRDDARRLESSEASVALLLGLGTALDQALALGIDHIRARIHHLAQGLRGRLDAIPGVTVRDIGDPETRSGLVSFTVEGLAGSAVRARLMDQGLTLGANGVPYTPLDMTARGLTEIARASLSYLTTEVELDRLADAIAGLAP
ncbi:aminotransferase class V-fold PLP-dependent enzyme [Nitrospirillum viridazoti]|uniref:Selenocysteine lyase/cysteine desulfurase n=1 Tax=Nitrospirillum amazonense TaxID=28077 RepID=A0A560IL39_9PROT|nr:aminotransferase class V-fold PLP-dependent enzyme [Nitrospirillum amazonense]TWB59763.1 selenocysteine lyase/cysteine desulfurase [Nitrospirillum amazonense]